MHDISEGEIVTRKRLRERSLEVRCPEQRPKLVVDAPGGLEEAPSICIGTPTVIAWNRIVENRMEIWNIFEFRGP